jgi:hypothetical protein
MDDSSLNALVAIAGLAATLLGVILTSVFSQKAEKNRRKHQNATRWHEKRLDLSTDLINISRKIEENVLDTACFTDNDARTERLPGHKSVLLTPEEGIPDILDEIAREIMVEALQECFNDLAELGRLISELQLIGDEEEYAAGNALYDAALDAIGVLECFSESDVVYGTAYDLRRLRSVFVKTSRAALGITK